ncbi:hypothetical protein KAJ27_17675 [bacterium]|nr:hypothetical protein [bacterium]
MSSITSYSLISILILFLLLSPFVYGKDMNKSVLKSTGYKYLDSFKDELNWGDTLQDSYKVADIWSKYLDKFDQLDFDHTSSIEYKAWKFKFYQQLEGYYKKSKEAVTYRNISTERDVLKDVLDMWLVLYPYFELKKTSKSSYFWFAKIKNYYRLYECSKSNPNDSTTIAIQNVFRYLLKIKPHSNDRVYYNMWLQDFTAMCQEYSSTLDDKLLDKMKFYLKLAPFYTKSQIVYALNEDPEVAVTVMMRLFGRNYKEIYIYRNYEKRRIPGGKK